MCADQTNQLKPKPKRTVFNVLTRWWYFVQPCGTICSEAFFYIHH